MASSRVAASQPQAGSSDLARFRSGSGIGSMNMDDIMRNIYGDAPPAPAEPVPIAAVAPTAVRRTSSEVWKEISDAGGLSVPVPPLPAPVAVAVPAGAAGGGAAEMTLEDFLARDTGAARAPAVEAAVALGFPDGDVVPGVGGGRARKRAPMEPTDRAVVQRQKRMIKNRESAARSRDRKQAYVAELESQVSQLEVEQAELMREQEEQHQKRLKELMEKPVPVIRRKPLQDHRRTNSMEW